jgi:alkylated DNA repair dioxygenase AlkB
MDADSCDLFYLCKNTAIYSSIRPGAIMSQLNFFSDQQSKNISTDFFDYRPGLFTKAESQLFKEYFIHTVPWEQQKVMMYGKEVITPRLTAWFGDRDRGHERTSNPNPWTKELLHIKARVEKLAEAQFNYVLLNYYRDGNDSVAWHDDMDRTPGKNKIVSSVSFGQERYFDIRNKKDHSDKFSILLEDGSYILMKEKFQENWHHRIAKSTMPMKARINLTFRVTQ